MAEPVTASVFIDAPCDRVYEYFVHPDAIVRWMGEYALLEPEPEGRFHLDIQGAPVRGRYLALEPPHRLLVSWGYAGADRLPPGASTVEIRLTPEGSGTRVELEHRDLPDAERRPHAVGWEHYLMRLRPAVMTGNAGPDPGMPPVNDVLHPADADRSASGPDRASSSASSPNAASWPTTRQQESSVTEPKNERRSR